VGRFALPLLKQGLFLPVFNKTAEHPEQSVHPKNRKTIAKRPVMATSVQNSSGYAFLSVGSAWG
jgi:hypothetical protein